MNSISVIGTGAIGGYYGAKLAESGFDVHFLLNSDYEFVRQNGLSVQSPDGDIFLNKVNAWKDPGQMPKCDLILITLKTTVNYLLNDILPKAASKNSKILVLQNGLDTDKDSADTLPENEIFGGLCSIACNKVGPGKIKHISYNEIRMGQYLRDGKAAGITESLKQISRLLNSAGIKTVLNENITEARWRKLVWNIAFNGLTTVYDCHTQTIMKTPEYRQRAINIMGEAIKAANSCGIKIEKSYIDKMVALTDSMAPYKPSMKLDFENNRPLEMDVIYYRALAYAKKNNCSIPHIEKLSLELDTLTRR